MIDIIDNLAQVYNTLLLVSTKGEDTIYMSECLKAIKNIYIQLKENSNNNNDNIVQE